MILEVFIVTCFEVVLSRWKSINIILFFRFRQFSKFGDSKSDGKMITLSQSDKWMKQAKVIDKKITTTDTGIYFKKFKYIFSIIYSQ